MFRVDILGPLPRLPRDLSPPSLHNNNNNNNINATNNNINTLSEKVKERKSTAEIETYISICLSIFLSIYLSIHLSIYLSIYPPIYLLSIYLYTYPPVYKYSSLCPSINLIYRPNLSEGWGQHDEARRHKAAQQPLLRLQQDHRTKPLQSTLHSSG